MKAKLLGYMVTTEYFFGEPLELCAGEPYPWPVLLRADDVTVFKTRKAANRAIEKTIEWARLRETEDKDLRPLDWAEKDEYKIWPLREAIRRAAPAPEMAIAPGRIVTNDVSGPGK